MLDSYAKDWIESARWRTVKHTCSNRSTMNQVTRVSDNPPLDAHAELLRDLSKREALSSLVVDAKVLVGPWMPVAAWIEMSPAADGTQAVHPKVYQALRLVGDASDTFVALDGCLKRQSMVYVYDSETVEDVSRLSSSGVEVELQGIRRDEESGLFTYVKVITEAIEKDVGSFVAHADAYSTRKQVTRLNQREQDVVDADGKVIGKASFDALALALAEEHKLSTQSGGGVVVDVQVEKNGDCTANLTVVNTHEKTIDGASVTINKSVRGTTTTTVNESKVDAQRKDPADGDSHKYELTNGGLIRETLVIHEAKPVVGQQVERQDAFSKEEVTLQENAASTDVTVATPVAANGVTQRKQVALNDDGTVNVQTTTTTEFGVPGAVVEQVRTVRGLRTETQSHSQAAALTEPDVGVLHRSSLTKGALYHTVVAQTVPTAIAPGDGNTTCKKTIFSHEHVSLSENQESVSDRDVSNAGSGKTYERVVQLNDDGTFNIQDRETEEIKVEDAVVDSTATATSITDQVMHANKDAALSSVVGLGEDGSIYKRKSQKTPGGRYETTETRVRPIAKIYYYSCAERYNGQQEQGCLFYNLTAAQVTALAERYTDLTPQLNEHGLFDGRAMLETPPYKSGNAYDKAFDTFEQWTYGVSDRTVSSDGKIYTVLTFYQKHFGLVYDSDIVQNSANNPYNRVQGYKDWYVDRAGVKHDGFYKWGGVCWSREIWFNEDGSVAFKGKAVGSRNLSIALPGGSDWTEAIA